MMTRMLKNDLKRNRMITVILCVFIILAAMLVSGAISIILTLLGSMDTLLERADTAHFAQLHAGSIEQREFDDFVRENNQLIRAQQTVELLGIDGANIYINNQTHSEADSLMENSFVRQNEQFDYLLDTDNQVLQVSDGEIAVPIYHMQRYDLQLGDKIWVADKEFQKEFTIVAFLRDSLMNPSVINSKRFLVSDKDWELLQGRLGEIEYMIEFQLHDPSRQSELETLYQDAGLPQKGTAMGYSLVKVINGMSDGVAASVIVLIAVLLLLIAALCLRFTMLTTIEEDYREIGVMKAIGIGGQDIRKLYMAKYVVMSALACVLGYLLSLLAQNLFTANISLYMGTGKQTVWTRLPPIFGAGIVFTAITNFCMVVLRRFRRISALEALRSGMVPVQSAKLGRRILPGTSSSEGSYDGGCPEGYTFTRSRMKDVNLFLGVKEVFKNFRVYGLLCFVFILCSFLMIVPINFLSTLESPDFLTYMGAGKCDLRLDLQHTPDIIARYEKTEEYLQKDEDIQKYAALFTSSFKVLDNEGKYENMKVEVGDFSSFPLEYTYGTAPQRENEIALSSMNAEEYQKKPGDVLTLVVNNEERRLNVCGIYQDVTNGGKTAKALLPFDMDQVIWFTVNMDLKEGVSLEEKRQEYMEAFQPAKVTDIHEYIEQTLGGIMEQLRLVVKFAFALAVAVSVLITAMFFKMLITKEARQVAIMKSMGFTVGNVWKQYLSRAILILIAGTILGTLTANLLGEKLAGLLVSGISHMRFVINPLYTCFLCPLTLILAVTVTITFSRQTIRRIRVMIAAE